MLELEFEGQILSSKNRIIQFEYTDETQDRLDTIQLSYFDLPQLKPGIKLKASLVANGAKWELGEFTIITLKHDLANDTFNLSANQVIGWQEKKSRAFETIPIDKIVEQLAKEMNLQATCDLQLNIDYLAQKEETNYNFLVRLAKNYHSKFAIKNDQLLFTRYKTKSDQALTLGLGDLSSIEIDSELKGDYHSLELTYLDTKEAKEKTLSIGKEPPKFKMRHPTNISPEEARNLAQAKLDSLKKSVIKGNFTMPGRFISAGMHFKLDHPAYSQALFYLDRLTHKITNNWSINAEFTRD